MSQFNSYKSCFDIFFVPNKIYYDATKGVEFVFDKINSVFLLVFLLSIVYEHACALLVFQSKSL